MPVHSESILQLSRAPSFVVHAMFFCPEYTHVAPSASFEVSTQLQQFCVSHGTAMTGSEKQRYHNEKPLNRMIFFITLVKY